MPLTGVVVPGQIAAGVDDFFVVARMMVHVETLVVESVNGILFARSEFEGLV